MPRKKSYDDWHMKGGGVGVDGWKVGSPSKPTRVLPKNAKLKALGKPLRTSNDYSKVPPLIEEDPVLKILKPKRKKA